MGTLAVVVGSEHIFDLARDIVFAALKDWVVVCICGGSSGTVSVAPCGPGAVALQLHGGGRAEPFSVRLVKREFLLKPETKGYSEKVLKANCSTCEQPQPSPSGTPEHSADERAPSKERTIKRKSWAQSLDQISSRRSSKSSVPEENSSLCPENLMAYESLEPILQAGLSEETPE